MSEWETLRSRLDVGDNVEIVTESPLYPGPYSSSVVAMVDSGVRIAMPFDEGRLVLIPVGTAVRLRPSRASDWSSLVVVDRRGGAERFLELRTPLVGATDADQAEQEDEERPTAPVIAVTSGKGGVGKTTFTVNLAIALEELGKRTCIIDADLGTANVDVLLKLSPAYNLGDVVSGAKHMVEVLVQGPGGILVLPGGSGLRRLTRMDDDTFEELMNQFHELEAYADVILIDTGSGVAPNVSNFVAASSEAILVTTPEPHAITDAYAMLKVLAEGGSRPPMHLVVNRIQTEREGEETTNRMVYAARRFLQYELKPLGVVREDPMVLRAVRQQVDILSEYPRARAAQDIRRLAEAVAAGLMGESKAVEDRRGGAEAFLRRIRSLVPKFGRDRASSMERDA